MVRTDIINFLIEQHGLKTYLEIGLDNPDANFNKVNCRFKHSVDPFYEADHIKNYDLNKTSPHSRDFSRGLGDVW